MHERPLLIDLFCCQGGAGVGYSRAGFDVVGVDMSPQPRYPFELVVHDALSFLRALILSSGVYRGRPVAAVHASPPCQARSDLRHRSPDRSYPELIVPTQELLDELGLPFVIENVDGADELRDPVMLCGANDDFFPSLRVIRHRYFETNWVLEGVDCPRDDDGRVRHPLVFTYDKRKAHYGRLDQDSSYVQVTGGGNCTIANKRAAMGTPWMTGHGCNEAIPPAYSEHVGRQLMDRLREIGQSV